MLKRIAFLLLVLAGCTPPKPIIVYMPFQPPDADSAGRDLFQFYGYEDTLGHWHECGFPRWKRTLSIPPNLPQAADEGNIPPPIFFGPITKNQRNDSL